MTSRSQLLLEFDFPGGAGMLDAALPDGAFRIRADPSSTERARGYDYFFCVRVTNPCGSPVTQRIEARRHDRPVPGWRSSRIPLFISSEARTWFVLDGVQADATHEQFAWTLALEPGQQVYVSNSLPYPSQAMVRWLRAVVARHPGLATLERYGTTPRGAELLALTIAGPGDPGRDRVLVTSGFHPAEADWLATTAIIDALVADTDWAGRMRAKYAVHVIPQVNPDGFDCGFNACNTQGVNLYWDFRRDDMGASPEAVMLWRWIKARPPALYLDFHAYVYQLHKDFRPYLRPLYDYPAAMRPVARAIDRRLVERCEGRAVVDDSPRDPRTLAPQLTEAYGTVTYPKFHLHLAHGPVMCRQLGIDVFRAVVEPALAFQPLSRRVSAYRPGRLDRIGRWIEQGYPRRRLRGAWRRFEVALGRRLPVREGVRCDGEPGLAPHWRAHLWSRRAQVSPVFCGLEPLT